MKKRLILFISMLFAMILVFAFLTTGFAISRTHSDSVASNGLSATARMQPAPCHGSSNVDVAKLRVRGKYRPILEPGSSLANKLGSLKEWSGSSEKTSTVSVSDTNVIVSCDHMCYVHCAYCSDRAGSTSAYH